MKRHMKTIVFSMVCLLLLTIFGYEYIVADNGMVDKTPALANTPKASNFSDKEKETIKEDILNYLSTNAKEEGRAVSNRYFGTSSISNGDWYAMTDKGDIQLNRTGKSRAQDFDFHVLTGAVVYTSNQKITGFDKTATSLSNIEGYSKIADLKQPVTKYIFTEEGQVYEYTFKNEPGVTLSSGFAPKDYNDKDPNLAPNEQFTLTHNKELSRYYQKLIDQ
ncbi:hypothetical protein DOS70_10240 [Staphylococcus felis]|uniref:hypothetical protein n=1 Tax=Staphylococcus felis TaxID=46127 RepID=UPI000E222943|nr:hypothetical protein [Staphylococcus felis]REH93733.1 hypothetical protein DOS70_10240 [Staphylococcus felis]REI31378.1 hypothetical protein DOS81_02030 [Staphylococcus felis]